MMRSCLWMVVLLLSACAGDAPTREVSRTSDGAHPTGMTYEQFSNHSINAGARDSTMVQKRFLLLDRDNNGVLTPNEFGGY